MRQLAVFIAALFLFACASEADEQKGAGDGSAAKADSPRTADTASAPPPSPPAGPVRSGGVDGLVVLRKLAAAQRPVLIDGHEEVPAGEFVPDEANSPSAYAGDYHFGDSEGESTLSLTVQGNAVSGRLAYGVFKNEAWVAQEVRLEGGSIEGATLTAPGWSGVFVRYQGQPGLVILRAPTDVFGVEFGEKQ
jgi:hypothetical protein